MNTKPHHVDFLIVGGGMAGVSAAAFLAGRGRTLLLERETALATHSTGRSAALYYPRLWLRGHARLDAGQ